MGKAALLIAFGASLFVAHGMLSQSETEHHTSRNQGNYEDGLIAREIARTGFNVAMGILRDHENDIHAAIAAINKHGGGKYLEGQHQGGTFRAFAELKNGHTVKVTSLGYFGGQFIELGDGDQPEAGWCAQSDSPSPQYYTGACHTMADDSPLYEYDLPSGDPLTAKLECSRLETTFIESMAGYCSAVYMQRILPDSTVENPTPEPPELLFVPGNNRDGQQLSVNKYMRGGTQMNFFIAVDKNCSLRPTGVIPIEDFPEYTPTLDNPSPYDHIHYALEEDVNNLGEMTETVWAFTEMHPSGVDDSGPDDIQRWRIGWEDQHRTEWNNPNSENPANSFQALKRHGYDGDGWPDEDSWGYRTLRDYGSRPDYSDQVVEVKLTEEDDLSLCGITVEDEDDGGGTGGGGTDDDGEDDDGEDDDGEDDDGEDDDGEDDDGEDGEEPAADCACPKNNNNKKVAVWHQTRNQKEGRMICISENAVNKHLNKHEDHVICRGD